MIGLRVVAEMPLLFARVVVANTMLPNGTGKITEAFLRWRDYSQAVPDFSPGRIVSKSVVTPITALVARAYDAPFPDESYKAGARAFPMLVPTSPDDPAVPANLAAWEVLRRWTKPFLTAFSDGDPITAGGERVFQKHVPGAAGQPHVTIRGAGHFLQEDQGEELARVVADFARAR